MLALVSSQTFPVNKLLTEASLGVLKLSGGDTCGASDKAKVRMYARADASAQTSLFSGLQN